MMDGEVVKHCYESGTAVEVVEDKSTHPTLYILEYADTVIVFLASMFHWVGP